MPDPADPRDPTATLPVGPPRASIEEDGLAPGTAVDRFVIERRVGAGGMGIVYVARDPKLDRAVALKLLRYGGSGSDGASDGRARLQREALAMAKLSHPNVVTVYEVGSHQDQVFIAMELVDGGTAKSWLKAEPRTWAEVLRVFVEAGRGLEAAHTAGFVHRDFKPDNVLLSSDGRVRVTDFGLARAVGAGPDPELHDAPSPVPENLLASPLTIAGTVVGTVAYMSPEQMNGESLDARADVYSFCVALYEAAYGMRPPRPGVPTAAPVGAALGVPGWVKAVLEKGLAANRDQRYPGMAPLLTALTRDTGARRRTLLVAAGAGLLLAALAVALLARRGPASACESLGEKLAQVWSEPQRQALAKQFAGSEGAWTFAERAIDAYVGRWREAGRLACAEGGSQAALQLRLECLDERLGHLRVAVDVLGRADAKLRESAALIVDHLPVVSTCSDARALNVVQRPSAEHAARVAELNEAVLRANIDALVGQKPAAIASLEKIVEEAGRLGFAPLEANALLTLASVLSVDGQYVQSTATYRRARDLAEANRLDQQAATAAMEVLSSAALSGKPREELDRELEPTLRTIQRAGNGPRQQFQQEHLLSVVYATTGRTAEALPHVRRAVTLSREVHGGDSLSLVMELNNSGAMADTVGEYAAALDAWKEALAVERNIIGKNRDSSRIVLANIVLTTSKMGLFAEAKEPAMKVVAIAERRGANIHSAMVQGVLANVELAAKDRVAAARWLEQGLATLKAKNLEKSPDGAEILRQAVEARIGLGELDEAVATADRLLENEKLRLDEKSPEWVPNLKVAGAAYLAHGQLKRAREVLERGLELATGQVLYPGWLAQMKFALAQTLPSEEAARAKQLCDEAEAELVPLPQRKALLDEVREFRSARYP